MMKCAIIYETSADGFGDEATDADRYAFARFVEERLEERFPGADVDVDVNASVLASRCRVTGDAGVDEGELETWIGNELWDEWCSNGAMVTQITDAQIEALRTEAGAAGDSAQVAICDRAREGDESARAECARVIANAAAMG